MHFTGRMPFLPPNQQRQSSEGNRCYISVMNIAVIMAFFAVISVTSHEKCVFLVENRTS